MLCYVMLCHAFGVWCLESLPSRVVFSFSFLVFSLLLVIMYTATSSHAYISTSSSPHDNDFLWHC